MASRKSILIFCDRKFIKICYNSKDKHGIKKTALKEMNESYE